MHEDEIATHARFQSIMGNVIRPIIERYGGRLVKNTGDGFLAEFASAVGAVNSAVEFQSTIGAEAVKPALLFRVGINVGDVIAEDSDIYGDHVNLAARLEQLADPRGNPDLELCI